MQKLSSLNKPLRGQSLLVLDKNAENIQVRVGPDIKARLERMVQEKDFPGLATLCRQYIKAGLIKDELEMGIRTPDNSALIVYDRGKKELPPKEKPPKTG